MRVKIRVSPSSHGQVMNGGGGHTYTHTPPLLGVSTIFAARATRRTYYYQITAKMENGSQIMLAHTSPLPLVCHYYLAITTYQLLINFY